MGWASDRLHAVRQERADAQIRATEAQDDPFTDDRDGDDFPPIADGSAPYSRSSDTDPDWRSGPGCDCTFGQRLACRARDTLGQVCDRLY